MWISAAALGQCWPVLCFQARLFLDTKKSRLCSRWVTLAALLSLATGQGSDSCRNDEASGQGQ